jgi:glycosyltransferase involved in cell wall biosynthesis
MSSVRVCAITCDCYPEDPLVRRTAEAAASAGCDYHVICSMNEGQSRYELFDGVHVHRILIRRMNGKPVGRIAWLPFLPTLLLWSIFTFLAFVKVTRLHLRLHFNVVHVHNMPDFLVFSAIAAKALGAQVILHVQDVSPELMALKATGLFRRITVPLAQWQERVSTAFADHVLTVGWPFEELLLKRGVPREKLSSVLNSADPNLFPEKKRTEPFLGEGTAERPIVLMYHGLCARRAGLDIAIRALARARAAAPHLHLHIMGGGDALPELKQLVQDLGITNQVVFFPPRSIDTVADFIAGGDIGIIPYRSDGFTALLLPTKIYELSLMRRPMIASDTVAIRSMFCPSSIVLCEPSNIESFADAMIDLYRHPQKRAQLVASAQQDYMKYRWELMAERYRRLLVSLATASGYQSEATKATEEVRG